MALDDPEYAKCIDLLRGARKREGITQAALAVNLSKPQSFVSKYENFERYLNVAKIARIAKAVGLPLNDVADALGWR